MAFWLKASSCFVLNCALSLTCEVLAQPIGNHPSNPSISQYAHTAWRVQDGAFEGSPTAITQTSDGYLWLGTTSGLYHFDGVRFVQLPLPNSTSSQKVLSLSGTKDGSLWVGTPKGLYRWNGGLWKDHLVTGGRVNFIAEAPDGVIWIAQSRTGGTVGGLCAILNKGVRCFGKESGFTAANTLAFGQNGAVLAGGSTGLLTWRSGLTTMFVPRGTEALERLQSITAIVPGKGGSAWVGFANPGSGKGLQRLSAGGMWSSYHSGPFDSEKLKVDTLLRDDRSSLWVGTDGQGLYKLDDGRTSRYLRSDGLSGNSIVDCLRDAEGSIWFATTMGVDRFRVLPVMTFSDAEGLDASGVAAVVASRDGTIWLSNTDGLDFLREDHIGKIGLAEGLPGQRVTSLLEDDRGRLWVGVDDKLVVYNHGHFDRVRRVDGKAVGPIQMLVEDTQHTVWARALPGSSDEILRIDNYLLAHAVEIKGTSGLRNLAADPEGGIWINAAGNTVIHYRSGVAETLLNPANHHPVLADDILSDTEGGLIGSTSSGLFRVRAGAYHILDQSNGLPCTSIYSLFETRQGGVPGLKCASG